MSKPSYTYYINHNDLEGAYERFRIAYSNWKDHWWETVEAIYNNCKDWAKKFVLDRVKRTLTAILPTAAKKRGRPAKYIENDLLTMECEVSGCGAYFVEHYKDGQLKWGKCGKADNGKRRLIEHFKIDYKGEIDHGIAKLWFPCINSDHALSMENVMRHYFHNIKNKCLLGKDRFVDYTGITAEDVAYLNKKYNELLVVFA